MWPQGQQQRTAAPVSAQVLEDRINMYISAMDKASAMNNGHLSTQLQRDIQQLVDLMERVSTGQVVTEMEVPPPLVITPQTDILANPLGELSSRLAEYHKALYFAEEELSDNRNHKIQNLQKGLQVIHELQKRAQDGFPVRADEIPPPVSIPGNDEFDPDAVITLQSRLTHYKTALISASQSESDRRRIPKIESAIRTIEFLLMRANAKRPVWKKDIPPEFDYSVVNPVKQESRPINKTKLILQLKSLQRRIQGVSFKEEKQQKQLEEIRKKITDLEAKFGGTQTLSVVDSSLTALAKEVEALEKLAFSEKTKDQYKQDEKLTLIDMRLNQYRAAAIASKQNGQINHAIQHFKSAKGLMALKSAIEKGEPVDMTLVPPPPRQFTPTSESPPSVLESVPSVEVAQMASGATAHLSPVNIKPAVESAEDKLAKKLFTYLDKGNSFSLSASEQMLNIHNNSITVEPSTNLLPKVQNSETGRNNLHKNIVPDDRSGSASKEDSNKGTEENRMKDVKNEQLLDLPKNVITNPAALQNGKQVLENIQNNMQVEHESRHNDKVEQGNVDTMQHEINKQNKRENGFTGSSKASTADSYIRTALDNVDFLSCQNVPSVEAKVALSLTTADNLAESDVTASLPVGHKTFKSEAALLADQQAIINGHITALVDTVDKSSTEGSPVTSKIVQSDQNDVEPLPRSQPTSISLVFDSLHDKLGLKEQSNDVESSEFSSNQITEQFNSSKITEDFNSNQANDHFNSNKTTENPHGNQKTEHSLSSQITEHFHGNQKNVFDPEPSSMSLPDHALHYSDNFDNEPSDFSSIHNDHIPDIVRYDPSSSDAPSSVTSFSHESELKERQELDTGHITLPASSNGRNSPDTLEFQDLMESMSMISFSEPVSSASDNPPPSQQPQPNEQRHLTSLMHEHGSSVIAEQKAHSNEVLSTDSQTQKTDARTQDKHYTEGTPQVSFHASLSSESKDSEGTNDTSQTFSESSKHTNITVHASKEKSIDPSSPMSNQDENQQAVNHTSDTQVASSGSVAAEQSPQITTNGHHPATAVSNSKLQNSQIQSQTWASNSHPQPVSLSTNQTLSNSRPANAFAYSDIAFTCLENLKYDCLLSVSKDTDEGKQEEKKLRVKFELIKDKLRFGGKRTWEVYKACVEREHASLIQQIEDLCLLQQWNDVKLLSQKKEITERELVVLRERLSQLKY